MAKYPREEIDYKKLYKRLDLDKDLNIDWPEILCDSENKEIILIKDLEKSLNEKEVYFLDDFDEAFCTENNITYDTLQKIFEKLDKNFLTKIFNSLDEVEELQEYEYCDICGKATDDDLKRMIICQGCNISVHEECYGVVDSPSGRWLCRKCIYHFEEGECVFCNKKEGILKKTEDNKWCHVICALLHPNLSFCNSNIRDPIEILDDLVQIEGNCKLCNQKSSYLVKCSYEDCDEFYHPSCCSEVLYCDLNNSVIYCEKHDPLHKRKKILSKRSKIRDCNSYPELFNKIELRENQKLQSPTTTEYMKIVKQEPQVILENLEKENKTEFFVKICEFWKEKRKNLGFYFHDIFIFSNRFLKK